MREKNIIKNFITEVVPQFMIAIIGLFKSQALLECLGEQTSGLFQIFGQIMAYLSLLEGGMGVAAIYRLYKPLIEKDYELLGKLKRGIGVIFRRLAIIIFFLGIALSFVIPFLIKDNQFSTSYIQFNFMLYLIGELVLYFTVFERNLFTADEKGYKVNILMNSSIILKGIFEIIILKLGGNLTQILLMFIVINFILYVALIYLTRKNYSMIIPKTEGDYSVLKDVKNLFVHKISNLITNNIDVLILSKVMGLTYVVIYTTYNMIITNVNSFITKFYTSTIGSVGKIIVEKKEESNNIFKEFNAMMFFVATVIGIPMFFAMDYFINIWYKGQIHTNIMISILFTAQFLLYCVRIPMLTFSEAAGLFKETRICPILGAIINLVLSLILVQTMQIEGVLIATVISLILAEYLIRPVIIYKKIFGKGVKEYYFTTLKFIIPMVFLFIITAKLTLTWNISSILDLFIATFIIGCINLILTFIYYYITKELVFLKRLKRIKRREQGV